MSIVYIAGPMTGKPNYNREAFAAKMKELIEQGYTVLSPHFLPDGLQYRDYIAIGLAQVQAAEAIFMLPGWRESDGARAEFMLAVSLGLSVHGAAD